MDNEQQMVNRILERFPYLEGQISVHGSKRISSLPLTAKNFHEVFNYAITEEGFSTLNSIIGLDNGDQMFFVYALSDSANTVFLIKLAVPAKEPAIKSVCSIFPGALLFEKELADMLKSEMPSDGKSGESGQNGQNGQNGQSSQSGFDFGSLAGLMGGQFDPNMLTAVSKVLAAMNGEDKNRALLMALRPHLSGDKQERVDKAVRMLKLYSAANALKDSGLLGSLDSLL